MVVSSSRSFGVAVARIIRANPHGFQKELARKMKISPQYLSDLLAGRKSWPDEYKDRVAHQLGSSVSEILQIGETLLSTGQFFPYIREVSVLAPQSEERAEWIMKRAGTDEGLGDVRFLTVPAVRIWSSGLIEQYFRKKESDADLYERARAICRRILRKE